MTMTDTEARFVKPVTCRRCAGNGDVVSRVVHAGMPGGCFKCAGLGIVEGDRATIAAAKARSAARRAIRHDMVEAAEAAGMKRHRACDLVYALDHLEANAPARHEAALASFQAGHPGLLAAIVTYAAEQNFLCYGATALTAAEALAEIGA